MGLLGKLKIKKDDSVKAEKSPAKVKVEEKEVKEVKKAVKKAEKQLTGNADKIFVRPFISEKAATTETSGVYTFVVDSEATKIDVKNAVKQVYGVQPKKIRMLNMEGKWRRYGRSAGKRGNWKKAIVTLSKGQTISIHEGV